MMVFTDGRDNSSAISAAVASARAIQAGVPIYTVARRESATRGFVWSQVVIPYSCFSWRP
jgi:hypothetical protein